MKHVTAAAVRDGDVTRALKNVTSMLRHPATLADPELLAKAAATNEEALGRALETLGGLDACIIRHEGRRWVP
jgi:hypothetical protein